MDFNALKETQVEPIYKAWLRLTDKVRKPMEQNFQDIIELATEGGSKAILDEANLHGEDLAEQFAKLASFHERAFWTLLERQKYRPGALAFYQADTLAPRYRRKRKNLPRKPARVDDTSNQDQLFHGRNRLSSKFDKEYCASSIRNCLDRKSVF